MKRLACLLVLLCCCSPAAADSSANWGWLLSIPSARSAEQLYKVRILAIDDEAQKELLRYAVAPGKHRIRAQLMLDMEWEPDLSESALKLPVKDLELEVEVGKTYLLAGKVDFSAPAESQLDQSYWEPIVYAVQ